MKLCGIELFGNIPSKIIRKGNQFVRTKTLVTTQGNITARLQNDTVTIIGSNGQSAHVIDISSRAKRQISKKDASELFFKNFERLFDPKYDATPAIENAIRLEKTL